VKVSIIGLGYIGLPTATLLASRGFEVVGVDVNQETVETINQGKVHIVEPELDELVSTAVKSGNLRAVVTPEKADVFMVAVPTPLKDDNKPDLSFVESAVKSIAPLLEKGNLILLESTSPVGTTEKMISWIKELRPDLTLPLYGGEGDDSDISVAYCPERVLPGSVVRELVENNRIIGGISDSCAKKGQDFYSSFVKGECLVTDARTAEMSKLVENSFRDVNIAFANELSLICDKVGINVWKLIKMANYHPRVNILQPGPGVGGHCIAVDPWFIVNSAPEQAKIIREARLINDYKPTFVMEKVEDAVCATGKRKPELSIATLGLAFKPNIDDLRESPALSIAKKIDSMGFKKQYIVEPNIDKIPKGFESRNSKLVSLEDALKRAEIILLLVDHKPFKEFDYQLLSGKQIIDTRGIWTSM